jgi:hypothetical protein
MIVVRLGHTSYMTDERLKKKSAEFNKLILSQLKPRIGRETAKMLTDLADDTKAKIESASFSVDRSAEYSPAAVDCVGRKNELMVGWLDEIFDCFQQFQFDFNKTIGREDLYIHVERPTIVNEQVVLQSGQRVTAQFFKGVLCTPEWALVIRGQNHLVEVFILPTRSISALSFGQNVARLLVMVPYLNEARQQCWRIDTDVVAWEDVRTFAKQLFGCLVKLAKGELELTTNAGGSFPLAPKAPVTAPVSASEALEKLRNQTAASVQSSASAPTDPAPAPIPAMDPATSETLQALLDRKRKSHEIKKLTGRTKARFRSKFGETLEEPGTDEQ